MLSLSGKERASGKSLELPHAFSSWWMAENTGASLGGMTNACGLSKQHRGGLPNERWQCVSART